jgi:hypothetical protein
MAQENDLVLIYLEDKPLIFARIEGILADHKPDWYHVKLLLLQIPPQVVTWILRNAYINGTEFTMNGKPMRLEKVEVPVDEDLSELDKEPTTEKKSTKDSGNSKVIDFTDLKKK